MKTTSVKIKQHDQIEFYQQYYNLPVDKFKLYCISVIENARAPNRLLIEQLKTMNNKDMMLKATNNFIMKGHGYGVV